MKEYMCLITINSEDKNEFSIKVVDNYNEKNLYYVEKDDLRTVNIYDYKNNIIKKDNDDIYLELKFDINKPTKNKLVLKRENKEFILDIETKEIIQDQNSIKINYSLNDQDYLYKIEKKEEC